MTCYLENYFSLIIVYSDKLNLIKIYAYMQKSISNTDVFMNAQHSLHCIIV